jgi:serine/threonine protein kinase
MAVKRIGQFQVLSTLGKGANSTLLHVRRTEDSKSYALKVVPVGGPDDLKFLDQARHEFEIAEIRPPHLIKIYALETQRNWFFRIVKVHLLIEYVNGKTLDTFPHRSAEARADLREGGLGPGPDAPPRCLSRRPQAQ